MGYLVNVKKLYFMSFFQGLIPAYVIERLFWQGRGMSVKDVVYCEIIYALTIILLEVPSGILSDKFGRKKMIYLSSLFDAFEFILLFYAHSFPLFALTMLFTGTGAAFESGSRNALLYDSLLHHKNEDVYEKIQGRMSAANFCGLLLSAGSGSLLSSYVSLDINYIVSFLSKTAVFFISLTLKEPPLLTKTENSAKSFLKFAFEAVKIFREKPVLLSCTVTAAIIGGTVNYLDEFWQLLAEKWGVPVILFGALTIAMGIFRVPGEVFAYKLKNRMNLKTLLIAIILLSAVLYTLIYLVQNPFSIIFMALILLMSGISEPLISGCIHANTDSAHRATVESMSSLVLRLATMLIGLGFGFISDRFSIYTGFAYLAIIMLCFSVLSANRKET